MRARISCSATATARVATRVHEFVRGALAGMGYRVKVNDPYKGVELVARTPIRRRAATACRSKSQALYMDETTLQKSKDLTIAPFPHRNAETNFGLHKKS